MKKTFPLFTCLLVLFACKSNEKTEPKPEVKKETVAAVAPQPVNFKAIKTDYKKDPVCGMPITAGIEDTLLYNGKIIGFCSKECKASFVKSPKDYTLTSN
jgi:YHS domain-containing protein